MLPQNPCKLSEQSYGNIFLPPKSNSLLLTIVSRKRYLSVWLMFFYLTITTRGDLQGPDRSKLPQTRGNFDRLYKPFF